MRNNRIIGVVTVRQGWAVQSFGDNRYLPLGRPHVLLENLDRWGADEILLSCIDRGDQGPDLDLLRQIAALGLTTPLVYAGGVRNQADAVTVVGAGADRVAVDAAWHDDPQAVIDIHQGVGSQALLAALPLGLGPQEDLHLYDYRRQSQTSLPAALVAAIEDDLVSEVIIMDYKSEGTDTAFDLRLLDQFPVQKTNLIAFGGVKDPDVARTVLNHPHVVAVGVGNYLNYREHAVQFFKRALGDFDVRAPRFNAFKVEQLIHAPDL